MAATYEITYCVRRVKDALDAFDDERDPDHLVSMRKWLKNLQDALDSEVEDYKREDAIHDQHLLEEEEREHLLDVDCIRYAGCN